jgi:hypothetical protein
MEMSSGTLLVLLFVAVPVLMMFMHRGGRAGGGMGCCGGHGHGEETHGEQSSEERAADEHLSTAGEPGSDGEMPKVSGSSAPERGSRA